MRTRLTATHGTWQLLIATVMALALLSALAATASAASPTACRVQNAATGKTYKALQTAVGAAGKADRLTARGTCHGGAVIDRDIVIKGETTQGSGDAVLDGRDKARVLTITPRAKVSVRDLVVTHGMATGDPRGGGIHNEGRLTLMDVVVRDNRAGRSGGQGGGIYNEGVLRLLGGSRVESSRAREGAGIYNAGTLTMRDSSGVVGNFRTEQGVGHGVYNTGTLTMKDASSIRKNIGGWGGNNGFGVYNSGSLVMTDTSTVSGNRGGVINLGGSVTMTGSSSIRYNVFGCPFGLGSACLQWRSDRAAGLYSRAGTVTGVLCAPQTLANVYRNGGAGDCDIQ